MLCGSTIGNWEILSVITFVIQLIKSIGNGKYVLVYAKEIV